MQNTLLPLSGNVNTWRKKLPNLAKGYSNIIDKSDPLITNFTDNQQHYQNLNLVTTAGSIISTANDILKWSNALFHNKILPKLLTGLYLNDCYTIKKGKSTAYCYGIVDTILNNTNNNSFNLYKHNGGIAGFSTFFCYIKESNITIVMFNNSYCLEKEQLNDSLQSTNTENNIKIEKTINQNIEAFNDIIHTITQEIENILINID